MYFLAHAKYLSWTNWSSVQAVSASEPRPQMKAKMRDIENPWLATFCPEVAPVISAHISLAFPVTQPLLSSHREGRPGYLANSDTVYHRNNKNTWVVSWGHRWDTHKPRSRAPDTGTVLLRGFCVSTCMRCGGAYCLRCIPGPRNKSSMLNKYLLRGILYLPSSSDQSS